MRTNNSDSKVYAQFKSHSQSCSGRATVKLLSAPTTPTQRIPNKRTVSQHMPTVYSEHSKLPSHRINSESMHSVVQSNGEFND